ncbi:MAG: SMC family ATPase [Candidatus Thermoplasmatota archaeon]|nr:SMC family ATPase [Candidatus Thermoplasmatota archaeon]
MILKNLQLTNYRKFKKTRIDFPDGVTGIVGLNGVGKSTIFEAISWAIYGPNAARTSADQIRLNGADPSDPCRVELEFVFSDDYYRITREMSGKNLSSAATVLVNGQCAASSVESANKYIQKKLGMDYKSFFTSIFAKQKELNALSTMNPSERRPLILKMLGIDILDEIIKTIKDDRKEKSAIVEKLGQNLWDESGKNKIQIHKDELKDLESKNRIFDDTINEINSKIRLLVSSVKEAENRHQEIKNLFEELQKEKDKLEEIRQKFESKKALQKEITKLQNSIQTREKILSETRNKLKNFSTIDSDIDQIENRLKKINDSILDFVKNIQQKNTMVDTIKDEIKILREKNIKITKMGPEASCPTCERVLGNQYSKLLEKFGIEKTEKEKRINNHLIEIQKDKENQEKIDREKKAIEKKRKYFNEQLKEKERLLVNIDNITSEIDKEKREKKEKENLIIKLDKITFDENQHSSLKSKLDETYAKYKSCQKVVNEKKDNLSYAKIHLERVKSTKQVHNHKIQTLKKTIKELEDFEKIMKEEKKIVQQLSMLKDLMNSFRTDLISRIGPTLSSYASEFFDLFTEGKYSQIELDENYDIKVYDRGEQFPIRRFSGGEEDLSNLCLRLAISEIITERAGGLFNFIILDEIFGSQDSIRRQNIMRALNTLSSKFRQIFLITHIDDVKNYMENIIYVSENEDGTSTVKIE